MRVFVTSCETGEGAWRVNERKLKYLYGLSDRKHSLTDSPDSADLILIGNVREENWGEKTLENELINRYPNRCFSLSEYWYPLFLNHGIYANSRKSIRTLVRVRTGSYTMNADRFRNPYIERHVFAERDYDNREYLLAFVGRNSHALRDAIFGLEFERRDILIEESSSAFDLWGGDDDKKLERQKYYYDILRRSKFSLCPRGSGTSSIRLFESMQLGVAPFILSDDWIFPRGPRWEEFSIVAKERHVREIERIVESHESSYQEMGQAARKAFEAYFAEDVYFNYVVDDCVDIMNSQLIPEVIYWKLGPLVIRLLKARALMREARRRVRLRSRLKGLFRIGS